MSNTSVSTSCKLDACQFLPVHCSYCKEYAKRIDMATHVGLCYFRPCVCKYCGFKLQFKDLDLHYGQCSAYPIQCKNIGCTKAIIRTDLDNHLADDCLWEPLDCEYRYSGCEVHVLRKDMEEHMEKSLKEHLYLVSVKCKDLITENGRFVDKCSQLEAEILDLNDLTQNLLTHVSPPQEPTELDMDELDMDEACGTQEKNEERDIRYLMVTNLPDIDDPNMVKSRFGQYGSVTSIELLCDRNSAIVEYSDIFEYRRAIGASENHGINLLKHRLHVYPIYEDDFDD